MTSRCATIVTPPIDLGATAASHRIDVGSSLPGLAERPTRKPFRRPSVARPPEGSPLRLSSVTARIQFSEIILHNKPARSPEKGTTLSQQRSPDPPRVNRGDGRPTTAADLGPAAAFISATGRSTRQNHSCSLSSQRRSRKRAERPSGYRQPGTRTNWVRQPKAQRQPFSFPRS